MPRIQSTRRQKHETLEEVRRTAKVQRKSITTVLAGPEPSRLIFQPLDAGQRPPAGSEVGELKRNTKLSLSIYTGWGVVLMLGYYRIWQVLFDYPNLYSNPMTLCNRHPWPNAKNDSCWCPNNRTS